MEAKGSGSERGVLFPQAYEGVAALVSSAALSVHPRPSIRADGTGRGTLPPGPIDNARLLGKGARPLPNQRPVIHYRGVAPPVWAFLHGIYGGGPPLPRRGIDLYGRPPVASAAVAAAPASAPAAVAQPQ